jgi:hypothetical protein
MRQVPVSEEQVKKLLKRSDITQLELCTKQLRISHEHFCRCLKKGYISEKTAKKICDFFGCSIEYLSNDNAEDVPFIKNPSSALYLALKQSEVFLCSELYNCWMTLHNGKSDAEYDDFYNNSELIDDMYCLIQLHLSGYDGRLFEQTEKLLPIYKKYKRIKKKVFEDYPEQEDKRIE